MHGWISQLRPLVSRSFQALASVVFGLGLVQVQGVGTARGMSSVPLETIEQEPLAKLLRLSRVTSLPASSWRSPR